MRVVIPCDNWNSVLQLVRKTENWIIYKHHISKTSIGYDSKIFYVHAFNIHTIIPEYPMTNPLISRIQVI